MIGYEDQSLMDDIVRNFDEHCSALDETRKQYAEDVYKELMVKRLGRINEQLSTPGGTYGYEAIIGRARHLNIIAARNPKEWFHAEVFAKYRHALLQSQGELYNELTNTLAEKPLMEDDDRFDSCSDHEGYIVNNELKASDKTTNDGSLNSALRKLKRNAEMLYAAERKTVVSALCIINSEISGIQVKVHPGTGRDGLDNENADLRGFHYLLITGSMAWQWLFGIDGPEELASANLNIWSCDIADYNIARRAEECYKSYERMCRKHGNLDPEDKTSLLKLYSLRGK